MHYYLAPYRGTGNKRAGGTFKPATSQGFSGIDLRPDPTQPTGFAVIAVRQRDGDLEKRAERGQGLAGTYLGEDLDDPAAGALLMRHLGLTPTFDNPTPRYAILDLLTAHATPPGDNDRWNPLEPAPWGWEVHLGGEKIIDQPHVSGGALSYTESFDKANSSTLGPDLTWSEVLGNTGVLSNQAENYSTSAGYRRNRAQHDLATSNMYAQVLVADPSAGSFNTYEVGPSVRFATSADTSYQCQVETDGYLLHNVIDKIVAGVRTTLSDVSYPDTAYYPTAAGEAIRIDVVGSTIVDTYVGTSQPGVTDTSITGNTRAGFHLYGTSTQGVRGIESWEAGDIATPSFGIRRRGRIAVPALWARAR